MRWWRRSRTRRGRWSVGHEVARARSASIACFGIDDSPAEPQVRELAACDELVRVGTRDPQESAGLLDRPHEPLLVGPLRLLLRSFRPPSPFVTSPMRSRHHPGSDNSVPSRPRFCVQSSRPLAARARPKPGRRRSWRGSSSGTRPSGLDPPDNQPDDPVGQTRRTDPSDRPAGQTRRTDHGTDRGCDDLHGSVGRGKTSRPRGGGARPIVTMRQREVQREVDGTDREHPHHEPATGRFNGRSDGTLPVPSTKPGGRSNGRSHRRWAMSQSAVVLAI